MLVVDDEQSLAKVVASYLERDGHQVAVFDGPAAVEAIGTWTARASPGICEAKLPATWLASACADAERQTYLGVQ